MASSGESSREREPVRRKKSKPVSKESPKKKKPSEPTAKSRRASKKKEPGKPAGQKDLAKGESREQLGPTPQLVSLEEIDQQDKSFQYRLDEDYSDLTESIDSAGQVRPIDLWGGQKPYPIMDGFRRFALAKARGEKVIRAAIHEGMSRSQAVRFAFLSNSVRKNLSQMERINVIRIMLAQGVTKAELPLLLGVSERTIRRDCEDARIPDDIWEIVDGRTVTIPLARVLADFKVKNLEKWKGYIHEERPSTNTLRKRLVKEKGKPTGGRPRTYVHIDGGVLRVYSFKVSEATSAQELEEKAQALEQALELVKELLRAKTKR